MISINTQLPVVLDQILFFLRIDRPILRHELGLHRLHEVFPPHPLRLVHPQLLHDHRPVALEVLRWPRKERRKVYHILLKSTDECILSLTHLAG